MGSQEKKIDVQKKNKKATIKDIARLANVSITTVSLSFHPNSRIGKNTREKVLRIAKELNYLPNLAARDLRTGHTKTIGFLVNDITNPFYSLMVRISERIAMERGYEIIFAESGWDSKHEENVISKMLQSRIEGCILCFTEENDHAYDLVRNSGLPHVVVDTKPTFYNGSYVINDGYYTGYISAEHLCEIGCNNIAFLNAKTTLGDFSSFFSMLTGFQKYFEKNNNSTKVNFDVYNSGLSISSGITTFKKIRKKHILYDGIFCMSDLCAMGVMHEAKNNGLLAGKDYAIIGVDNNDVSDLNMLSLSSINIFYDKISKIATNHLIDQIENKSKVVIEKMIKPTLIVRGSTDLFKKDL